MPRARRDAVNEQSVSGAGAAPDWSRIAYLTLVSRALDALEETVLVPAGKVIYQFSARGHDMAQIILGTKLTHPHDAISGYYRSRPLLLALGADPADMLGSSMARAAGYSDGRDIGAVFNYPSAAGAVALPMCGGVGAQYTPAAGWAQALRYRQAVLGDNAVEGAVAVALGGDASVATNGFWSALTIATTLRLPVLFYIEDNGYGISVPSAVQTPGGDIAANLRSFKNLEIVSGEGTVPDTTARLIDHALSVVRQGAGPCLLRLRVPRLEGHSFQDTQTYKSRELVAAEWERDPLPGLRERFVRSGRSGTDWEALELRAKQLVDAALETAEARPPAPPDTLERFVFAEPDSIQLRGGQWSQGYAPPTAADSPDPHGPRINMVAAIRRTLEREMSINPRVAVFGEDVGPKGGVHGVTLGLQDKFGPERVFDTSLSEEGIVGRAVGMALAGLVPVPEIQFRKYADPAAEQINDCGTIRWRTANRFAAPIVLRMPVGFLRTGDPWHSQTNEVQLVHSPGWRVAMPSNAEDAVGLLRAALRGNDPVAFLEHRALLDAAWARAPYPGDDYVLPFGRAKLRLIGDALTIVTWGAMAERCEAAAMASGASIELIDLRTLVPWDRDCVLESVRRTRRCLIVHEDLRTAGFGAEIAAVAGEEAFLDLDAPVARLTMPDVPSPHSPSLFEAAVPSVARIRAEIDRLIEF